MSTSLNRSPAATNLAGIESTETDHRALFLNWAEPDLSSGTPVILCDLLDHFKPDRAEMLCEASFGPVKRRQVQLRHPVRRINFHNRLWPFRRGSRVRQLLISLGVPWIVLWGLWRVMRFRPTCIIAIYFQPRWILASYLVSRLSRVPLIFLVHDAMSERASDGPLKKTFKRWLEPTALRGSRVVSLNPYMAEYYYERYGATPTVLRHVMNHEPLPARSSDSGAAGTRTIGFCGAIYDSNSQQLAELARTVDSLPGVRFCLWTEASPARLAELGICGQRVEVGFESEYERLLQKLAGCDLLYLPLSFHDTPTLTTQALQFTFPTKTLDYLVVGAPILAHCPGHFELARFFFQNACGYVLTDDGSDALKAWLAEWRNGRMPPLDERNRLAALELFSAAENRRTLWRIMDEATGRNVREQRVVVTMTDDRVSHSTSR